MTRYYTTPATSVHLSMQMPTVSNSNKYDNNDELSSASYTPAHASAQVPAVSDKYNNKLCCVSCIPACAPDRVSDVSLTFTIAYLVCYA